MTETHDNAPETAAAPGGYRVLARKYRPETFEALIGQEAMVRTLANAFATGRIAQAYMLTGVRGVGKTTTARLIARALNYTGPGSEAGPTVHMTAYGEHCRAILESRHVDVIEMDAASRTGIDDVREIIEQVRYKPLSALYKVYIIDEVHMLSKPAFNALLKTLEEPPPHVKFIFATTEIRKVPVTVLSRCQRFDLRRLDIAALMAHMAGIARAEAVSIDEESLRLIARASEGSVRDGLSLLDQAIAHCGTAITADRVQDMLGLGDRSRVISLFEAVMHGDSGRALAEFAALHAQGGDPQATLADLADLVHWVTRLKIVPSAEADKSRSETERTHGRAMADALSLPNLTRAWQMLLKGLAEVRDAHDPRAAAEMVLIRLAYGVTLPPADELAKLARDRPRSSEERAQPSFRLEPGRQAEPAPRLEGMLAVSRDPVAESASPAAPKAFSHFRDIVAYVGDKRDVKLKGELERYVRPVRTGAGMIEIALEPEAPPGLAGELARKLEAWTGDRWIVLIAKDGGEAPMRDQARLARDGRLREARDIPAVRLILEKFPGAEITDVRGPQPGDVLPEPDEATNEKD